MWKKRILCLVLVLCSILVLSSCQKKETFMTLDQQQQQQQPASQPADAQNLFGETALPQQNIIQQASQSILAQANQRPQAILSLLGGN